ncbi:deoxyribodipyrimidine photo-lyase [Stieleria varia]|nr:deoxyribodipyrimidine photo-lyase [Stieleria varia]
MVWFRRDLRIADNAALFHACQSADDGVVGVFAICPEQWSQHDDAPAKVQFWIQNVACLSQSLGKINIPLLIVPTPRFDELPSEITSLAAKHECDALYFNREYEVNESERDDAVAKAADKLGITTHRFHDRVIVPPDSIETQEGKFYTVFTPYRRVWDERVAGETELLASPKKQSKTDIPSDSVPTQIDGFDFSDCDSDLWPPGEDEAKRRLKAFEDHMGQYDEQRDIPSVAGTSRLSPYLAAGVISPRQCLATALNVCGGNLEKNDGAKTWVSELTWRDFYTAVLVGFPRVSKHRPFKLKTDAIRWRDDESDFNAWCAGQTGYPIVDAGMRQLNQTGWMHNRLRMVVAMFLTKHLLIDWRWGERHFMNLLIDGDLAANNGGWQWSASTGTDSVPYFRIFNPFSQSKRFDPDGDYIKEFCPELKDVPASALHDQKKLRKALKDIDIDYPDFVVDYSKGRQRALDEFKRI